MNDEELAARRALIDVHCGACGATFPGDTQLSNGACRECCRSDVHLIRKVERYHQALEVLNRVAKASMRNDDPLRGDWVARVVANALDGDDV